MCAKGTPLETTIVKFRLNRQNRRNLHAPAIAAPYLCTKKNQKCLLALLALSKTPSLLTQRKLRHRSTRTLNPLADAPPHHASPISITTPHKPPSSNHRDATGAYLWHALLIYCTDRSTSFGMPSSVASVSHFRVIRVIRVLYCRSFGVLPSAAHLQSKTPTENIRRSTEFFWRKCFVAARDLTIFVEDKRHLCNPK